MLLMVDIVIDNVCVKKKRNIRKTSDENLQKTAISGIYPAFSAGKKFSKNGLRHVLIIPNTHL